VSRSHTLDLPLISLLQNTQRGSECYTEGIKKVYSKKKGENMPWFCYGNASKKSSKKTKKSKKKSGRKEIERCQKYVVILKDYVAATMDEVSVHRGQVVEMVCTKGNWVYIRGNNSSTGYVPLDYTAEVDKSDGSEMTSINLTNDITLIANGNLARLPPSSRSINVGTLHHSGSSITSVEVHQMGGNSVTEFRDSGERQATPSSIRQGEPSQAIYEVPHCPDRMAEVNLNESGSAPALPPRSSGLPSATEIQQSLTSYRSASNTPHHYRCSPTQKHRPGNLALVTSAVQPCPYHRPRYPYGPFPPNTTDSSHCTCHPPMIKQGTASITTSQPSFLSYGRPPPVATPRTPGSFSQGHSSATTPGYSPPVWTPPHGASRRGINSNSPLSQHRHISRPHAVTTPGVPQTPGSASLPSATPASPVVSNFALTPRGSRDFTESLPTKGNGIRVSSSSARSYGRRAVSRTQRCRRYSSDLQVHSTISENTAPLGTQQDTPSRHPAYSRRRSQPCLVTNSAHAVNSGSDSSRRDNGCSQQTRRPNALPVRRSLSMHEEPHSAGRSGRNSCPCTPQQYSLHQQHAPSQGAEVQMQRAFSCMETMRMGGEKPATTGVSNGPVRQAGEVATTPQQAFSASITNVRRRRSRSSSNRLDSVPSIEEEGVRPGAPDDVFLPEAGKKPVGIFKCTKTCSPRFKGEITLQENEMVIVLDYGMGQWAWVLTAANSEGLVSKSVLERYRPDGLDMYQSSASGVVSDGTVFDDSDSGRGTITKERRSVGVNASTQTSPVVVDRELNVTRTSVSTGLSTGYSTSSTVPTTSENSPLSTAERAESGPARAAKRKRVTAAVEDSSKEVKDDNMVLLEAAATAVAKHAEGMAGSLKRRQQAPPQEWFNTIDSLDDRERIKPYVPSRAGSRLPSSSQLLESSSTSSPPPTLADSQQPKANNVEVENPSSNSKSDGDKGDATHLNANDKPKEKTSPVRSSKNRNMNHKRERRGNTSSLTSVTMSPARLAAKPADQGRPATNHIRSVKEVVKPGTTHYHDRISGRGSMSQSSGEESPPKLGRQKSRPQIGLSNVLTVVKDYNPAPSSKNCIPIKEGDILHLQTHMHYPKGWMWVWHTSRRTFGYVPKSYVAYTYDTVRRGRPRINTVEDAV